MGSKWKSEIYLFIYIYIYIYMVRARHFSSVTWWYIMLEGLSVSHFLKHSNHW